MIRKLFSALALVALVVMFGAAPQSASAGARVGQNNVAFHDNFIADHHASPDCVAALLDLGDNNPAEIDDEIVQTENADSSYVLNEYTPCAWPADHGWSFLGWSLDEPVWDYNSVPPANALNVDYKNGAPYNFRNLGVSGGMGGRDLWAVWSAPTLTYSDPQGVEAELECTLPDPQMEFDGGEQDLADYNCDNSDWSGHQFNGWTDKNKVHHDFDESYDFSNGNLDLAAVWTPLEATVTYADNVGPEGCTVPREQNVKDASWKALKAYNCTWAGHEFLGWSKDESLAADVLQVGDDSFDPTADNAYENGQYGPGDLYDFSGYFNGACGGNGCSEFNDTKQAYTGDADLFAVWRLVQGTVVFQDPLAAANGCSVPDPQPGAGVEALSPYECEASNGTVFVSWSYFLNGRREYVANGGDFDFSRLNGETITLTAHYDFANTTVHFIDETTTCTEPADMTHAGIATLALTSYSCANALYFAGWSLEHEGAIDYVNHGDFEFGHTEGVVNLYAVWTSKYNISFDEDGGSNVSNLNNVGYTSLVNLPVSAKECYDFLGWEYDGTTYTSGDSFYMPDENPTLTAQWDVHVANVTFVDTEFTSGTDLYEEIPGVECGDTFDFPNTDPTHEGYTFVAWSNGGQQYTSGSSAYTMPDSAIEFQAVWDINTWDVTFDEDPEYTTGTDMYGVEYSAEITLPAAPEKGGYTFTGWSTGGSVYDAGDSFIMPDSDVEFIAQWSNAEPPVNRSLPTITPTSRLRANSGTVLTAHDGSWDGDGIDYSYEWYACTKAISASRARNFGDTIPSYCVFRDDGGTYALQPFDYRKYIVLFVTADNGVAVTQMSKSTIRVSR